MAVEFLKSVTRENLMRAFAGESQARNRYTFAAQQANKQQLFVIEKLFEFIANQEKEHAEVFYNHLKPSAGETVNIPDAGYPVDIADDIKKLLRMAEHNEYEESRDVYPAFAEKAKEEGYFEVYSSFSNIATVEENHGKRFGVFASHLENGTLFSSDKKENWYCMNCGYIFEGTTAPLSCPSCKKPQGYFIRLEMTPWGVNENQKG